MAEETGLGGIVKKIEKTSLEKFKNQNKALKKFGKPGLKVYRAVRKRGISIDELAEKTGLEMKLVIEILLFLKEKGMVETVGEIGPEEEEVPETEGPMGVEEKKIRPEPSTIAPEAEIAETPAERKKKPMEPMEEEGPLAPESEEAHEEEGEPAPEDEFGIEPEEEPAEGIEPLGLDEEEKEEAPAEEDELSPLELKGEEEETPEEEGGIEPLGISEEEEAPVEEEEPAPEEEEEPAEDEDEIAPSRGRANEKEEDEDEAEDEDIFLTPGERKIKAQYGQVGIDVYNLIDGQRTAEEIMKDTGVTEATLIEMLDFMEKNGIIKLEHPSTRKPKVPSAPSAPAVKEVGFAPMLDEHGVPDKPLGGELGKEFTLGVPAKAKSNLFKEMQMKANLMIKFKQPGVKAFELVDGNRDVVEIALKTGIPLYTAYKIMEYLQKEGMVAINPSNREEIRRKYGEDGYSVYKKYGREGVMLYQLIGKDLDLREMAKLTSEDKKRVVEIFMFIHKLLGIELPIDEDVLLERLEEPGPSKK